MFHLRCNCDVAETYRKTFLRRLQDVLLPGEEVSVMILLEIFDFWSFFGVDNSSLRSFTNFKINHLLLGEEPADDINP